MLQEQLSRHGEVMVTAVRSIGNFQVLGTLGTGAHSTILHIRRTADSTQYALKVVPISTPDDLKYLDQAEHEFQVANKLDHPNLIKIYALETVRNWMLRIRKVQLLIEYVNGKTLDVMPRPPMSRLIQIFVRVAAGLAHMHRREVYHADLKPNNIIVSRTGDVKIFDFGLARIKGERRGRIQGTPEYMAPEQAKRGIVNELTDIYNFGATMYRMVTGRLAPPVIIAEGSDLAMDAKLSEHFLQPVQECTAEAPPELCEIIHRCLSYDAKKRPEHASEIHSILDHLAAKTSPDDPLEEWEWE
jgi:eukaryotic-like serine/threonine-protein kinase